MLDTKKWYGPYDKGDGRKIMVRHTSNGDTSMDYARWKVVVKGHHALSHAQQVDHKNNDRRDDRSSNLQIMSKHDNIAKGNRENPR